MKCTNKEIGERVPEYAWEDFTEDEEIELHLLECPYCWKKVQIIKREKDEQTFVESFIRSHISREAFQDILKEIKESGDKKLPLNKEMSQEDEQHFTIEPMQEQIPTLWLMLNNAPKEQIKCSPGIPWTTELLELGLHSVINQEKQILFQIKKLPEAEKGVSVRGAPKDSFKIETKTIQIPLLGSTEKGELTIKVERRKGRYFLTLLFKIRDS